MNHDKTAIYPNDTDINGVQEPKKSLISFEKIQSMLDDARQRFKGAKAQIPLLEEKLLNLFGTWRDALLAGEEQKTQEITSDIDKTRTKLELLKGINEDREFDDYMKRNGKFMDTVKVFEKQELKRLNGVKVEQEKAIELFRETRAAFLEATRALGNTNYQAQQIINKLNSIHQFTDRDSGYYSEYVPITFTQFDIVGKFGRAWLGGCSNTVYPEPQPSVWSDNQQSQEQPTLKEGAVNE